MECSSYASRRTKFAPVKSLRFFELFLGILLSEFRFIVFFPLGCGVDSWIPPLQFFQTAKGKAPKEAWSGHLSGGGINVTFLRPHVPQLSAMRCVTPENLPTGRCLRKIDYVKWVFTGQQALKQAQEWQMVLELAQPKRQDADDAPSCPLIKFITTEASQGGVIALNLQLQNYSTAWHSQFFSSSGL